MSVLNKPQRLVPSKLELVLDPWDEIIQQPDQIEMPGWHRRELDALSEKYSQQPDLGDSWEAVEKRMLEGL